MYAFAETGSYILSRKLCIFRVGKLQQNTESACERADRTGRGLFFCGSLDPYKTGMDSAKGIKGGKHFLEKIHPCFWRGGMRDILKINPIDFFCFFYDLQRRKRGAVGQSLQQVFFPCGQRDVLSEYFAAASLLKKQKEGGSAFFSQLF